MKIFASLDTVLPPRPRHMLVGREVANATFLEALWRNGDFDAYHFFAGDRHDANQFREFYQSCWEKAGVSVEIFSRFDLLEKLQTVDYHVLHQSDFVTYFAELTRIRNRHAVQRFPVTAPIHTISYPSYLLTYLQLMLSGPRPYDAIICTSQAGHAAIEAGLDQVRGSLGAQIPDLSVQFRREIIPLGIELAHFQETCAENRLEHRKALGWPGSSVVTLCMGRFSESDKYDLLPLLSAFRDTLRRLDAGHGAPTKPDALLVLAGARQGTDYAEQLKRAAATLGLGDKVKMYVDVDQTIHRALYQAADIFVSPSDNLQETFGLTVLEAMATGLPVIVSDWDGYRDMVEDGVNGFRIPTYWGSCDHFLGELGPLCYQRPWHLALAQSTAVDIPALVKALHALMTRPDLRSKFGAEARKKSLEFAWPEVISRHLSLWQTLKKEALCDTRPPGPISPFGHPPFARFPSHASHRIDGTEQLELTVRGTAVLCNPDARTWYLEMSPLLDTLVVRHLCAVARRGGRVDEAIDEVATTHDRSEERVAYQLMWSLKQDLIRLVRQQDREADGTAAQP